MAAARDLLISGGPRAVSAQAVAAALSAPSESIYHRFASREALAAEVWLDSCGRQCR
ncbi:TetR family transcriptional regulator [Nocardioides limicola]|uniref:TetR family transcriptional regulator n=1 Tax=Nocardioides limicola TaxID=2803368 RepID=UPI00193BB903